MAKKEKIAFGVFQDGLMIKVAQLNLKDNNVILEQVGETLISTPFFRQEEDVEDKISKLPDEEAEFADLDDLNTEDFELDVTTDIESSEDLDELVTKKDESLPGLKELQNFLQVYPLEKGKIGMNANDERISYFHFDAAYAKSKLRKKLQQEMLTPEEIKTKDYILDYVINPNKSGVAFVHRGKLELFHALRDINLSLSKERYFYNHVDTNELALINLVKHNYECKEDEYVLLLYIGNEYKVGIVMKEGVHIKTFPIIVPEGDDIATRQAIYSKVILEQDISDMQITKNVILMGDRVSDEDLEFFREKSTDDGQIHRLELPKLKIPEARQNDLTDEVIAKYAIPISLAWKALQPKNKDFFKSNLLPAKVIENQKYFKIAWHGFVILALIFYFAFSGTVRNLNIKEKIVTYEQDNYTVESELRRNRGLITKLNEIKSKMSALEQNFEKVKALSGNKNIWYYILDTFSNSLDRNPLSWLENIASDNGGFSITGYTTNRRGILEVSELFPEGSISSISRYQIEDQNLWQFDITYLYPDATEIRMNEDLIIKQTSQQSDEQKEDAERILQETEEETKTVSETETQQQEQVSDDQVVREYRHTLDVYFAGDYQSAIKLFNDFLRQYPDHNLAYNVTYYKGECLYLLKRYNEAMEVFETIFQGRGKKAPDALMMLGNCWEKLGEKNMARASWNNLIADYPQDELAVAAKYKLSKLENK
ncbi:MAG: tetratricopeptide repeat protein [Candidatus Cloacimonetes bacterium]|nr:tetratricopeptide repeat protein [Candidatus Cloacimonadota bacterium]MCF7813644.1 tetratricopeptide repeat protein [Candidatus Cloacimonadota bacterium]MCF7868323.1 tetratricopeptide repeat protein [Candidatus Cloacimonadota bacterium]MCF7883797.1 tetratricopeptide repeat protein [Candidatus Cloacimonadota bacterium]